MDDRASLGRLRTDLQILEYAEKAGRMQPLQLTHNQKKVYNLGTWTSLAGAQARNKKLLIR